jgi:hypothetical protein
MQYHQSTAFPRLVAHSSRPGGFLELAELIDLHLAVGEHGFDLQLASHGSNHGLQSANVRIGAALHLGDCGLIDAEQVEGLAQPTRKASGLHSRFPPFRKERVPSHDILYKASRDILYTSARA